MIAKAKAWAKVGSITGDVRAVYGAKESGAAPDVELRSEKLIPLYSAEWQPIATAPRDGRRILAYRSNFAEDMAVVWWAGEWIPVYGSAWPEPTHWMPLPGRPTDA